MYRSRSIFISAKQTNHTIST